MRISLGQGLEGLAGPSCFRAWPQGWPWEATDGECFHLNDVGVGVLDTEAFAPVITFALSAAWDKYLSAAYQNGKMFCG